VSENQQGHVELAKRVDLIVESALRAGFRSASMSLLTGKGWIYFDQAKLATVG